MRDSPTAGIHRSRQRAASAAEACAARKIPFAFCAAMQRFLRPLALQGAPAWPADTRGQP